MTNGQKVIDCIHKEMGTGLDITFLPYQSSMWDSFDSVYKASLAHDRPHIYPIGYYSKDDTGAMTRMRIDTNYPFPCEPYEDYKSDVVVIHTPYGSENKITEVPHKYWASSLKDYVYTVYIPYFCMGDRVNEAQVMTNAVGYADMVIVETERQKAEYLRILDANRIRIDRNKFKVCGSPKDDMIKSFVPSIPLSWMNKANGRKVVLLITSLLPFINGGENEIQKILCLFERYKDDPEYCLLWREHPLIEDSILAMNPFLYKPYSKMRDLFDGIYDDTDDFHNAFAFSTMCISEPSSLVRLYKLTGKEIEVI